MPRKTDSHNPADWLWFANSDLEIIRVAAEQELSFAAAHSKLAEIVEKIIKAELLRLGWRLVKTHDLRRLHNEMVGRNSEFAGSIEELCKEMAGVYFSDRYPGYELDDPDWPAFRAHLAQVEALLASVEARVKLP